MKSTSKLYDSNSLACFVGRNIQRARENADGKSRGTLTQNELAEMANQTTTEFLLDGRTVGRIERGERIVNLKELLAISSALKISAHELLTGDLPEHFIERKNTGLNSKAFQTLEKLQEKFPDRVCALNFVLEDAETALMLIDAFVLYAESPILTISPLLSKNEENFVYIDSQTSDELMKQAVLQKLSRLLEVIRQKWELQYYPALDKMLEKRTKGHKKIDAEITARLRYKIKESMRTEKGVPIVDISEIDVEYNNLLCKVEKKLLAKLKARRAASQFNILRQLMEDNEAVS